MAITLRPVREDDDAFLRALYATTRDDVAAWGWPQAQVESFLQMQFRAQSMSYAAAYPDAQRDVIVEDGQPIGRLYVWRRGDEVRLVDISLLPAARGRGIGKQLLEQLISDTAARKARLRLQVTTVNPARRLYLRLGFRRTGGDGVYDEMEWSPQSSEQ